MQSKQLQMDITRPVNQWKLHLDIVMAAGTVRVRAPYAAHVSCLFQWKSPTWNYYRQRWLREIPHPLIDRANSSGPRSRR